VVGITAVRYANPMFAMRCACAAIEHPYHKRAFDERRRVYDSLLITRFQCLDAFIEDVRHGRIRGPEDYNVASDKYSIGLTQREMADIERLVLMFTIYGDQKIFAG
jgi:hypothetical protein